jgi:hypothetical protein
VYSPILVLEHDLKNVPVVKIGPPVYGHQVTDHDPRQKSKDIIIAINVSELELSNLFKMSTINCIGSLSHLTKLVLKGNEVTSFPRMNNLLVLESVHLSNMHQLKTVGKALSTAPALRSLDVHNCRLFKTITKSFIIGVTQVARTDPPWRASRFQTLRVTKCPFVVPRALGDLVGLRILYLADTCPLQIRFPALGSFVDLVELTVKHQSFSNFPPVEELVCLTSLERLVLQNLPIESVEGICLLTSLVYLRLTDLDMSHLPDEMGKLSRLRSLKIKRCDWFEDLPTSVGTLPVLETFYVTTTPANIRNAAMFPDTFMFRRTARLLPFMRALQTLQVAGVEDEEGLALAHVLKSWPPPALQTVYFYPPLRLFVPADDRHMNAWSCAAVVNGWQGAVLKAEAFLCGAHPGMGNASPVLGLSEDVLKIIVAQLLGRVPQPFSIHDLVDDSQIRSAPGGTSTV